MDANLNPPSEHLPKDNMPLRPRDGVSAWACPFSARNAFCAASLRPDCLHIGDDRSVRIQLAMTPEEWFTALPGFGEVIQLHRNSMSVLGRLGCGQTIADWRNAVLPRDQTGSFLPNLGEHASIFALRELTEIGPVQGFEFRDACGSVFQKIVLTDESRLDRFTEFVRRHQAPTPNPWHSPNHTSAARRRQSIEGRIRFLKASTWLGHSEAQRLPVSVGVRIIDMARAIGLSFRVYFYSRALIQNEPWISDLHDDPAPHASGSFTAFHSDRLSLHIDEQACHSVWLWTGICGCCGESKWTIEFGDRYDSIGLALTAASREEEPHWRDFIRDSLSQILEEPASIF